MYALLIIDGAGHVREYERGTLRACRAAADLLPARGWREYALLKWDEGKGVWATETTLGGPG